MTAERFAPKTTVKLDPPKHQKFTREELSQFDGVRSDKIFVAIKGTVFDVTRNTAAYGPDGGYHVFAGKDASRALGRSSLEPADVLPEYKDLPKEDMQVLDDWYTFFVQRYNIVGNIEQ